MVNKKVTIANSLSIDLLSFLLSASLKDIKLYKVIFIAESEEELKSLLMKVKVENVKLA